MGERKVVEQKHIVEETPRAKNGIGGRIAMSEEVVASIAGLAAREIDGIYSLGKSRLIPFGDSPTRGVGAEVGKKEAALDLEVVIEHGCDVRGMAKKVREKIAAEVERMAGRQVVEVNLDVIGIHLPDTHEEPARNERRVV